MTLTQRRAAFMVSALAGGLLAAAFLSTPVALADEWAFTPDTSTFDATQVEGYPPLDNVVTGTEAFNIYDITNNLVTTPDFFKGVDTETTIGSFTNNDFLDTGLGAIFINGSSSADIPTGSQFDLADLGGGWENEWISIPTGADAGTSDLLITPFGDVPLFGSFFADLTAAL
jgi:hypothetical protein